MSHASRSSSTSRSDHRIDSSTLDPESALLRTVRNSLEHNGNYLRKARCEMRKKVLEAIQGPSSSSNAGNRFGVGTGGDANGQPPRAVQLINQLILEYFDWYNLQYSAETFAAETGTARLDWNIRRQTLTGSLGRTLEEPIEFQPELPVLAELIMKLVQQGGGGSE